MKHIHLKTAALLGASAVALGALGAHWLRKKLEEGQIDPKQLAAFDTASKYQLFHTLAIFIAFLLHQYSPSLWIKRASQLFIAGIFLFSGSLYLLSTQTIMGANLSFLGPVTPIGGLLLVSGWLCLFFSFFRKKQSS